VNAAANAHTKDGPGRFNQRRGSAAAAPTKPLDPRSLPSYRGERRPQTAAGQSEPPLDDADMALYA